MGVPEITCPVCAARVEKTASEVNRARRRGYDVCCSRACAGRRRRSGLTTEQKKRRKAEYDKRRRAELGEQLREEKRAAYHAKPPEVRSKMGALYRKLRKEAGYSHSEYCRERMKRPGMKDAKFRYDREYRARKRYGEFWESAVALLELGDEIKKQVPDQYERAKGRGYYDRAVTQRKRDEGISRH
jgi:hypothetical protein